MHALIIEDEPLTAMLIEDCLRARGYTSIHFAATETDAVAAAASCTPDLITSDVRLVEGCGIAAVETICSGRSIPTLFITDTAEDALGRVPSAGVLTKPFTARSLELAMDGVASRRNRL